MMKHSTQPKLLRRPNISDPPPTSTSSSMENNNTDQDHEQQINTDHDHEQQIETDNLPASSPERRWNFGDLFMRDFASISTSMNTHQSEYSKFFSPHNKNLFKLSFIPLSGYLSYKIDSGWPLGVVALFVPTKSKYFESNLYSDCARVLDTGLKVSTGAALSILWHSPWPFLLCLSNICLCDN